ncbi:MAG: PDGLE domain-containing protein [Pseudonocardia sp.]
MNAPTRSGAMTGFYVAFLIVALIIAGGLSYFASGDPDGLDKATLAGCEVVEVGGEEQLNGTCIAQNAEDSPVAGSPFADYAVNGGDGTVGLAGVLGVVATLIVAGGLFWLLRRRGTDATRSDS